MTDRLRGLLGMARRAGALGIGFESAVAAVRSRRAPLVLKACDVSPKTAKELAFFSGGGENVLPLPLTKAALGEAVGRHRPVGVVAVCDRGLAKALTSVLNGERDERSNRV